MMKVSDYIVEFLIKKGIKCAFGYPGGSAANLINSFYKYRDKINAYVTYNEQGAAFAACGYSQASGSPGVAYSTGGPGATNLITGIGHAWFDSIPLICLTGNVNTYEMSSGMTIRQRAFQECEIIPIVQSITKYCAYIERKEDIRYQLEKAYYLATSGRKGPVLLDLPMDITKAEIDADSLKGYQIDDTRAESESESFRKDFIEFMDSAQYPCFIFGNGVKDIETEPILRKVINHVGIPYVTSMIATDVLSGHPLCYGFLGASGNRCANFITAKSDMIISIGSRLDIRQVGVMRENFAPHAKILRVDIDRSELDYKVHNDEKSYCLDAKTALKIIADVKKIKEFGHWVDICEQIRNKTKSMDIRYPNMLMKEISMLIPENTVITTDVGQNQVWTAQSFELKKGQKILFSGGFGSMGHALPAAIGAYYGSEGKKVLAIAGDGGFQMNIQELQFIAREGIPVKMVVFNNHALGMIRHFQEVWYEGNYFQTIQGRGFSSPSFSKIATAYGIESREINDISEIKECNDLIENNEPILIELQIDEYTYEYPKLKFGSPNQDQEPLMDRLLYNELMELK